MNTAEYREGMPRWLKKVLYPPLTARRAAEIRRGIIAAQADIWWAQKSAEGQWHYDVLYHGLCAPKDGRLAQIAYVRTVMRQYEKERRGNHVKV